CSNGVKDGDEIDTDCGGSCGLCGQGKHCEAPSDCTSGTCRANVCGFDPVGFWKKLSGAPMPPPWAPSPPPTSDGPPPLFGGGPTQRSTTARGDTWLFDGSGPQWPGWPAPTARDYPGRAYAAGTGKTLLVGGATGAPSAPAETWAWTPGTWTKEGSNSPSRL